VQRSRSISCALTTAVLRGSICTFHSDTTIGLSTIKNITSVGFDGNGAIIVAADLSLYQQTSSGWISLGPPNNATSITTTPQGTIYVVSVAFTHASTDNGRTWNTTTMPPYNCGRKFQRAHWARTGVALLEATHLQPLPSAVFQCQVTPLYRHGSTKTIACGC